MISEVDHSSNRPICTTTSAVDGMTVTTEGTTTAKSPLDSLTDAATATNTTDHSIPNDEDDISSNRDAVVKQQYELPQPTITLIAKYGKERITLTNLPTETTIGQIKEMIQQQTRILPIRQKFVGLSAKIGGTKGVIDELPISELAIKSSATTNQNHKSNASAPVVINVPTITHQFILMGTPEEQIFIDPSQKDDLPDIIDDFDFDFNAGSDEWIQHRANDVNLKQFTAQTPIHIMNEPRQNKPLLVLDLDHTLLDFSSKSLLQQNRYSQQQQPPMNDDASTAAVVHPSRDADEIAERMKRPYMDEFLSQCYHHYDLVIWSQTSWRWLETKLIELGMISHPGYKFCFVLDKVRVFLFLDRPVRTWYRTIKICKCGDHVVLTLSSVNFMWIRPACLLWLVRNAMEQRSNITSNHYK